MATLITLIEMAACAGCFAGGLVGFLGTVNTPRRSW
jgi:hypothetical protein